MVKIGRSHDTSNSIATTGLAAILALNSFDLKAQDLPARPDHGQQAAGAVLTGQQDSAGLRLYSGYLLKNSEGRAKYTLDEKSRVKSVVFPNGYSVSEVNYHQGAGQENLIASLTISSGGVTRTYTRMISGMRLYSSWAVGTIGAAAGGETKEFGGNFAFTHCGEFVVTDFAKVIPPHITTRIAYTNDGKAYPMSPLPSGAYLLFNEEGNIVALRRPDNSDITVSYQNKQPALIVEGFSDGSSRSWNFQAEQNAWISSDSKIAPSKQSPLFNRGTLSYVTNDGVRVNTATSGARTVTEPNGRTTILDHSGKVVRELGALDIGSSVFKPKEIPVMFVHPHSSRGVVGRDMCQDGICPQTPPITDVAGVFVTPNEPAPGQATLVTPTITSWTSLDSIEKARGGLMSPMIKFLRIWAETTTDEDIAEITSHAALMQLRSDKGVAWIQPELISHANADYLFWLRDSVRANRLPCTINVQPLNYPGLGAQRAQGGETRTALDPADHSLDISVAINSLIFDSRSIRDDLEAIIKHGGIGVLRPERLLARSVFDVVPHELNHVWRDAAGYEFDVSSEPIAHLGAFNLLRTITSEKGKHYEPLLKELR